MWRQVRMFETFRSEISWKKPTQLCLNFTCDAGAALQNGAKCRQKYMRRPGPPGGHDKSPPQSRRLSSRMLSDPEGAATNLPKGHTSSSTLTLSLLTPYSLQSSLPPSQEVHIVQGGCLRSTFQQDRDMHPDG